MKVLVRPGNRLQTNGTAARVEMCDAILLCCFAGDGTAVSYTGGKRVFRREQGVAWVCVETIEKRKQQCKIILPKS